MVEQRFLNVEEGKTPLKTIREMIGMSQQEFATFLGISITTVSRWERGLGSPSFTPGQFKLLLKKLEPFGVGLDELPDDLGAMTPAS